MFWAVPISIVIALAIYLSIVGFARERRIEREMFYDHETARRMLERDGGTAQDVIAWSRERDDARRRRWRESLVLAAYVMIGAGAGIVAGLRVHPDRAYWTLGFIPLATGIAIGTFALLRRDKP
jgi:hypothetical protein